LTQEAPLDGVQGVVARTHDVVVGLLPEAPPETLDRVRLRSSRLTAVVPVEDPFAQAGAVSLAQLAMRPLITWPRASRTWPGPCRPRNCAR
jgi:DNA-binding transcriptional LysR family regulator